MFLLFVAGSVWFCFFFFNDTATTEIYTLSLHDALPISSGEAEKDKTCPLRIQSIIDQRAGTERSEEHTLNSSHQKISYAVFCLKKKKNQARRKVASVTRLSLAHTVMSARRIPQCRYVPRGRTWPSPLASLALLLFLVFLMKRAPPKSTPYSHPTPLAS